jgi:hypothetical protein
MRRLLWLQMRWQWVVQLSCCKIIEEIFTHSRNGHVNQQYDECGKSYSANDLEALGVCRAVRHWRCYIEGGSKFLVVSDHDTLRHPLMQPNDRLNKRHVGYVRDLPPFVGAMTMAYRKGSRNEACPLRLHAEFYAQANRLLLWDGDVPQSVSPRGQS